MTEAVTSDASLAHLFGRIGVVERRVRLAVDSRRSSDPDPGDRFRGLYISDEQAEALLHGRPGAADMHSASSDIDVALAEVEAEAALAVNRGARLRLRDLAADFGLLPFEVDLLLVALAPDLDARFERLYGYLHDDVTRRRASPGLAFELLGVTAAGAGFRGRLAAGGPLVDAGLLLIEDPERPFLTRSLRVPDRVAAHLLGDDTPDLEVVALLLPGGMTPGSSPEPLARALRAGAGLVYVRERPASSGMALAEAALKACGRPALLLDLGLCGEGDLGQLARLAGREARLTGAGLVAGPVEAVTGVGRAGLRPLANLPCPVLLCGAQAWDPAWSQRVPLAVEAAPADAPGRAALWRASLNGHSTAALDRAAATEGYRLTPEQVTRAAESARLRAVAEDREISPADLRAGALMQNAAGLERLARRVEPAVGFDDLVLPADVLGLLDEVVVRARHRDLVLDEWGMRGPGAHRRGLAVLLAGPSGTGKTMAAEAIAGVLGLDLYVIDLATVVDKYIGETEKNLDRIFAEAERVNGVLMFDEADAVFGKRSEVRDAHDRYANIETAYLLQRIERFDGIAVLATNLRNNLDDAFARRLDLVIDLPEPTEDLRLRLWERCLGERLPRAHDVDLRFMAHAFKLAGGNIRNVTVAAAYAAAVGQRPVAMADLVRATEREYRKLGRLVAGAEFGPYYELVS